MAEPITDEDLAYLNKNIDIVDVFIHSGAIKHVTPVKQTHHAIDVCRCIHSINNNCVSIHTQFIYYRYYHKWRPLLEYVRKHDNTAIPILK